MVAKRKRPASEPAQPLPGNGNTARRVRHLKSQAWFWTPEWQAGEREADADLAAGRFQRFEGDDAFLEHLGRHPLQPGEPPTDQRHVADDA
jgi:hypothetical protein